MRYFGYLVLSLGLHGIITAAETNGTHFEPLKAPRPVGILKRGDRLAICGDSITEQKMYSRIMEDYLTMCVPEFQVTVRQFGWSGERAPGFLARMTNDCLRFKPTIATTCYGMNDHEYRPYEDRIGRTYRSNSLAIIRAFKANGVRVIEGAPGCVGKVPGWVKVPGATVDALNNNLGLLRNIDIEIARAEKVSFADVYLDMIKAGQAAHEKYGSSYAIAGADGVHPGWAGHTVMAYAFLTAMGLDGSIGELTVDLKRHRLKASKGHEVLSASGDTYQIRSSKYPFCACEPASAATAKYPSCGDDDITKDNSIRSATTLLPFNQDLNRFMLYARNGGQRTYRVTWGDESRTYTSDQLEHGINLAADFKTTPFAEAFAKVDAAVAAKQDYETREIKLSFRTAEARTDMENVAARAEAERKPLAEAIHNAFKPVDHTLRIEPL